MPGMAAYHRDEEPLANMDDRHPAVGTARFTLTS